ncbi:MAG: hypothetical protein ABI778_11880, partial [Ignavibacteriota bacterium]
LEAIASSCGVTSETELSTFGAKMRFHFGWSRYFETIGNWEAAMKHVHAIVDLYDVNPQHIQSEQLGYINMLMMLCTYSLRSGSAKQTEMYLDRFRRLKLTKQCIPYSELLIFRFKILRALTEKNWKELESLQSQHEGLVARYRSEVNSFGKDLRIDLHLYFIRGYLLKREYESALREIAALRKLSTLSKHPYHENNTSILLLIVHYELGNFSYLPYVLRSTYRSLLRRERLFEFESHILQFLRKSLKMKKRTEILNALRELHANIVALDSEPIEREFPWKDFYLEWIEGKIKSRSQPIS